MQIIKIIFQSTLFPLLRRGLGGGLLLSLLWGGAVKSFSQEQHWIKGGNASFNSLNQNHEQTNDLTTDENGNLYAVVNFLGSGSVTFGNHTYTFNYTGALASDLNRAALISYDCEGNIRWAKVYEGYGSAYITSVEYDNGYIYIAGSVGGQNAQYFDTDTITYGTTNSYACLLKYDTLGNMQWLRFLGNGTSNSKTALGNRSNQLFIRDTVIHWIKMVRLSGQEVIPGVISQRGVYDITLTTSGQFLNAVRFNIPDTTITLNYYTYKTGNMYKPENRIYISLQRDIPINSQAGIFEFDSLRNLVRNDTFTQNFTTAIANLVRYDNCLYVIGNLNSTPTTFMGQTFYPKNPGTSGNGIINFLMKVDLNRNLVWKRELNSITPIGSILGNKFIVDKTNQRLIVFGRGTKPFKIDHDSMYVDTLLGSGKIMATIFDTAGNLQQWDYWKNNLGIFSDNITSTAVHNGTIYAGGEHLSTIWTQDSSYSRTSNGGDEDFLILKYGFNCDCTPATSSFTYSKSGYDTLHFNYTGTFFGIDSFVWDFGDGSPKVSNILNPTHVYAPGTYTAFVKVYDSCGNTQSGKTIYVPCYFLTSHFTYSTNYQDISLTYTGTNNADSVRWNLGNGQWLTGTTASYTYPQSGTYEVCAIAYKGCTDTFCQQVVINCFEPVCSFTYDTMATLQLNLTYNGTTADSIRWFLGNGSEDTGSTLSYTYPLPGTYPVCAVAYKGCGSDTFC